ncbi:MAG: hypothetical protein HUK03_00890 [Bacteroidaceae bacterium]|nr:hypothetical protein [Bacteroidaceae bacterium]
MKRTSIISLIIFCMGVAMTTTSCQDMLSPNNERHSYKVAQDTLYSYWGIIKSLQNVAERYVILNECRGDLVTGYKASDSIRAILQFGNGSEYATKYVDGSSSLLRIRDFYHVINSCNAYIQMCDTERETGTDRKYMLRELAQVYAIRAWVYMQLVYAYGEVAYVDKPMLTTDAIEDYWANSKELVNAENLYTKLAPDLEKMYEYERNTNYGFPNYENYGDVDPTNSNFVCHSQKTMFPIAIVLGDLYLMSSEKYIDAAKWYFKFLNNEYGGPLNTSHYVSSVNVAKGVDEPEYDQYENCPWLEKEKNEKGMDAITCIPSVKGKLDGTVLTGINRLFGWDANLRAGGDTGSDASVSLTPNFDRELMESRSYDSLSMNQKYEYYLEANTPAGKVYTVTSLKRIDDPTKEVGDARRAWLYNNKTGRVYSETSTNGLSKYSTLISKQNPGGSYTTVYPMVYRMSIVWLRFAEAVNRAGYPSIAFAVLRDGICNDKSWIPSLEQYKDTALATYCVTYKDDEEADIYIPSTWKTYEINIKDQTAYSTYCQFVSDSVEIWLGILQDSIDATTGDPVRNKKFVTMKNNLDKKRSFISFAQSYEYNEYVKAYRDLELDPLRTNNKFDNACFYVSKNDIDIFKNIMDSTIFNTLYMRGTHLNRTYRYKDAYTDNYHLSTQAEPSTAGEYVTIGVHSRGCGVIQKGEIYSSYNYVDMVNQMIQKDNKLQGTAESELSFEEVYNVANKEKVMRAIESLILDEMGLELAFEGTRFMDLCRIAKHRHEPAYLAKRVARRNYDVDASLESHLMNEKNWYLPKPERK